MTRVVVQVVELNRRRHVELESITAALSEAVFAAEQVGTLEPVRELVRALRGLVGQALPEALMEGTGEVAVELVAPLHELEQLAEELTGLADGLSSLSDGDRFELERLAAKVRERATARA